MRSLAAVAFLPPADIPAAFHAVAGSLPDECIDVATYFESTYIGRELGGRWRPAAYAPEEWTQFQRTIDGLGRTNNSIEGWHRRFAGRAGVHPNVFSLIQRIQAEEDHWRVEVEKVQAGATPRRRKPQWEQLSDRLSTLAHRLRDGDITMMDYVRSVAHNFTF